MLDVLLTPNMESLLWTPLFGVLAFNQSCHDWIHSSWHCINIMYLKHSWKSTKHISLFIAQLLQVLFSSLSPAIHVLNHSFITIQASMSSASLLQNFLHTFFYNYNISIGLSWRYNNDEDKITENNLSNKCQADTVVIQRLCTRLLKHLQLHEKHIIEHHLPVHYTTSCVTSYTMITPCGVLNIRWCYDSLWNAIIYFSLQFSNFPIYSSIFHDDKTTTNAFLYSAMPQSLIHICN